MASVLVKLVTLVAMVMVSESGPTFPWVNEYDGQMDFKCPDKQIIMYLSSIHDNQRKDRIWEMLCRSAKFGDYCVQSAYVNNFDQTLNYTCPGNKVLTGISSYHYDSYEDRRFRFTCCRASKRWLSECYTTDFVNEWDLKLTLFVPEGQAIKSIYSINDDTRSDRRFKFGLCNL